jgi:hypothetical protein
MGSRSLRSRTAEACQESQNSPAGEEFGLSPCDQPVGLGSLESESSGYSQQEALQTSQKEQVIQHPQKNFRLKKLAV